MNLWNFKYRNLILKILVSLIFLTIIFLKIDMHSLFDTIKSFQLWIFLVLPLFLIIAILLNTFNIYILLRAINVKIPFVKVLNSYISAWLFGKVSTGKSGELSIVYFLTKENVELNKNIFVVFVDRVLSFFVLLIIALVGGLYIFRNELNLILLIVGIFLLAGLFFVLFYDKITFLIKRYILRRYSKYFQDFTKSLKYVIAERKKYLVMNFLTTFLKQINATLAFFTIFLAIGKYIAPTTIFLVSGVESAVSSIPIALSGIGISEGTAIVLYGYLGIAPYVVLSVYLFNRVFGYLFSVLIYFGRMLFFKIKN